jgi:nucleoside-diphosphate-sugar epimerase
LEGKSSTLENLELVESVPLNVGIVGADGFIGRYLTAELSRKGYQVIAWNREKHGSFLLESDRKNFLRNNDLDIVYQLAWVNVNNPNYRQESANFDYARASIELALDCHARKIKCVLLGSTYADLESNTEPYSTSKRNLQIELREISPSHIFLAKPTYVFSLEDLRPHLFKQFVNWLESSKKTQPFELINADFQIDLIHVKDVANALLFFVNNGLNYREYLLTSGFSISVKDVVEFLSNKLNGFSNGINTSKLCQSGNLNAGSKIISNRETFNFFGLNGILSE